MVENGAPPVAMAANKDEIMIMVDANVHDVMAMDVEATEKPSESSPITTVALQEQKNASTSAGLNCPVGESSSYKCIHLSFNLNDQIAPLEFMWKVVSKQLLTLNINSYQAFLHIKWGRMKTQICRFTSCRLETGRKKYPSACS
ncbi:hypothetical protein HanIR_Chr04g0163021 [Helianthus annuus]|nr:hypothetical protein HanIR_Chr04g0163021 [Helianthus annuus]KAJ0595976.1 hypothetical protein HanHA89_Chr04g0137481 [Helianthus annuus]